MKKYVYICRAKQSLCVGVPSWEYCIYSLNFI